MKSLNKILLYPLLFISSTLIYACAADDSKDAILSPERLGWISSNNDISPPNYENDPYTTKKLPFSGHASFSPDGKAIIFVDTEGIVKVFDIDTWEVVSHLTDPIKAQWPVWTDNDKIFFHKSQDDPSNPNRTTLLRTEPQELWVVNADGTDLQELAYPPSIPTSLSTPGLYWEPMVKVSPDGSKIVLARVEIGAWKILSMNIRYENDTVSLDEPRVIVSTQHFNEPKEFTTDAKKLVFASTRGGDYPDGEEDRWLLNSDVFTLEFESGDIHRYTQTRTWDEESDVRWGDNRPGDAVVFISDRDTPNPLQFYYSSPFTNESDWLLVALTVIPIYLWTSHELFLSGPEGDRGWVRRVTFDYDIDGWVARRPAWSPDGRRILFYQRADQGRAEHNFFDPLSWRLMLLTFE